jgi:hypothetical protein
MLLKKILKGRHCCVSMATHSFTSRPCFTSSRLKTTSRFTSLLHLCPLIFGLTPFRRFICIYLSTYSYSVYKIHIIYVTLYIIYFIYIRILVRKSSLSTPFLYTPTFSGTQLRCNIRAWCLLLSLIYVTKGKRENIRDFP